MSRQPFIKVITSLGTQGLCEYGQDQLGRLYYRFAPTEQWRLVAY